MGDILKTRIISLWIFIIPFVSINACLILITFFHDLFPNKEDILHNTIPYIDGGASISRTVRPYPNFFIFKPAMFLTSFLLIKYWFFNKNIINNLYKNHKNIKFIMFFGISSAVALFIHSIFLGIKFDNDFYKLFRRIIMLSFIIFEITAQAYLIATFYDLKHILNDFINIKILKIKRILVTSLIVIAIIAIPFLPFDNFKFLKHGLEWNFFLGVIAFYLLTFFMWKKSNF